jgi:hypothetical protein
MVQLPVSDSDCSDYLLFITLSANSPGDLYAPFLKTFFFFLPLHLVGCGLLQQQQQQRQQQWQRYNTQRKEKRSESNRIFADNKA